VRGTALQLCNVGSKHGSVRCSRRDGVLGQALAAGASQLTLTLAGMATTVNSAGVAAGAGVVLEAAGVNSRPISLGCRALAGLLPSRCTSATTAAYATPTRQRLSSADRRPTIAVVPGGMRSGRNRR
jgi:hypothetical protein